MAPRTDSSSLIRLSAFAPLQILLGGALLLLGAIMAAVWIAARLPWLGVDFVPAGDPGLRVERVHASGPFAGKLMEGDVVRAVHRGGERIPLAGYEPALIPHSLPTFSEFNAYLAFQGRIGAAFSEGPFVLELASGRLVAATPALPRPLGTFPLDFWLLNLFGLIACLIGLFVWAFRSQEIAARMLAVSGTGFFWATWHQSLWQLRELAMPPSLFDLLLRGNQLALHVMVGGLFALLIYYPRRLGRNRPPLKALVAIIVAIQVNENLHLLDWPLHSFYMPLLLYYVSGVALQILQWYLAGTRPLDRAALRWVFLSITLSMGGAMVVYFVPLMFGGESLLSGTGMVGIAVTLYVGFALGVLRYRLFELERWWFNAWIWFFGGVAVVIVDASLAFLFGLNPVHALGFAVIAVGWLYFPVRQWLWGQLAATAEVRMETYLPEFVQALFTRSGADSGKTWYDLLNRVFQPLGIEIYPGKIDAPCLLDNGARLGVPSVGGGPSLSLVYGQRGRRLFSRRDLYMAQALYAVAERVSSVRDAQQFGARRERQRIMRDLHDDVGGRLFTILHTATTDRQAEAARQALQALRDSINALDDEQTYLLQDLIDGWHADLEERLAPLPLSLEWTVRVEVREKLSPRQYINLQRIFNEAITNALKHAQPDVLRVTIQQTRTRDELQLSVCNNGIDTPIEGIIARGRGIGNMRTRAAELGGALSIETIQSDGQTWYCAVLETPLPASRAEDPSSRPRFA